MPTYILDKELQQLVKRKPVISFDANKMRENWDECKLHFSLRLRGILGKISSVVNRR